MNPEFILVMVLGLALGSFASAIAWRVPRGQSWVASGGKAEHSACPSCKHSLTWLDLVPMFSWLLLRGRCRYCGAKIPVRYPLMELATAAGCMAVYLAYGFTVPAGFLMLAMPFFIALIVIDLDHMILPDQLNIILAVAGVAFAVASGSIVAAVIALPVYASVAFGLGWAMQRILKKEALGMGDVKFFGVAGLWLGLPLFPAFLILSGLFGVGLGLVFRIWKGEALFPFGPALVLALLSCLLFLAGNGAFAAL